MRPAVKSFLLPLCLVSQLTAKGPANDYFAKALRLSGEFPIEKPGSVTDELDRFRATKEEGEPDHAGQKGYGSVWYSYTSKTDRKIEITGISQKMDLILAVYTGTSLSDLTLVHRYQNFASPAYSRTKTEPFTKDARVEFDAKAGTQYYIAIDTENPVDRKNGRDGKFLLRVKPSTNKFHPQLELVEPGGPWEYLLATNDRNLPVDPKSLDPDFHDTWMSPRQYDGPPFLKGRAPLAYGGISSFNPAYSNLFGKRDSSPPMGQRYTAYLRTTFTPFTDVSAIGVEGIFDDGAIFYLNGNEVGRINVSQSRNPRDWKTLANNSKINDISLDNLIQRAVFKNLALPADEPVNFAVSLHNALGTSSDLGLDLRIYSLSTTSD